MAKYSDKEEVNTIVKQAAKSDVLCNICCPHVDTPRPTTALFPWGPDMSGAKGSSPGPTSKQPVSPP